MKKIREIDAAAPAIIRRKYSKNCACYSEESEQIIANPILIRSEGLVIALMCTDVPICIFDAGQLQAIGRDFKFRKQYIYHSTFEKLRQKEKFKMLLRSVSHLSKIGKQAYDDIKVKGWPKEKLVA